MILRLLIFGIVLAIIIFVIARHLGRVLLYADYEKEYRELVEQLDKPITAKRAKWIRDKFQALYCYRCRDNERLDVLYREFIRKYRDMALVA
jgi:hypothetical protein